MKAVVYEEYGPPDVLQLTEVAMPVLGGDEALIKVHAVSISGSDRERLAGKPLYARSGVFRPGRQIPCSDIAGRVEAVGTRHTTFEVGDEVFGELPGYHGGLAEYVCTQGKTLVHKPAGLSFEEAAAIPQGGVIALQGIDEQGQVQAGQAVLINGAAGSAGSFAIQLAKLHGAQVTGVDHGSKLDFMRSLGADHVIDYGREDFTKNGRQYDLILDLIAHRPARAYVRALKRKGTFFYVGGSVGVLLQILLLGPLIGRMWERHLRLLAVGPNRKDLEAITALCEIGQVVPAIEGRYSLNGFREAFRDVAEGRAKGKVVISLEAGRSH